MIVEGRALGTLGGWSPLVTERYWAGDYNWMLISDNADGHDWHPNPIFC